MPEALVQETEEPERDVLLATYFEIGYRAVADAGLLWCGCQGVHVVLAVDDEHRTTVSGVDLVVAVQGGIEESFCYGLLVWLAGASGVTQVRVLHIYLSGLKRELLASG